MNIRGFFEKPITIGLSPNLEIDDALLAIKTLLSPGSWRQGGDIARVEKWFQDYFKVDDAVSFNSGRSALTEILRVFNIDVGDEVMVQAFTCVAVPNSVLWACATPVYVDIDRTYNVDIADLQKKLTAKTKAVIVQHTFGIPADMDRIITFCKKHHLILIEDCAHALGAFYKGKPVGSLGDAACFSFGRDKVISSVFGGMGIIFEKDKLKELRYRQKLLPYPKLFWIAQQLFHPIATGLVLLGYNLVIGKLLLLLFQKLRLLSFPVASLEKKGKQPTNYPQKFPNSLAALAYHQLRKLDRFNKQRTEAARTYEKELGVKISRKNNRQVFLRFPVELSSPKNLLRNAKSKGILLGTWYHNIIDPEEVDLEAVGYKKNSCPSAEYLAGRIINLPTRITTSQAGGIATFVKPYL